jgi:hypothetical protein
MSRTHEHDLLSIEKAIQQAKEERARHMAEVFGPALKAVGVSALVVVMMPWHAVRHALTTVGS